MTLQMALLEERMEGEERGRIEGRNEEVRAVAIKMLRKGKSFEEVSEFTDLSIQRLEELTKVHLKKQRSNHVKR